MNDRITKKERGLIKGCLRRVFSRSELRQRVLAKSIMVGYSNPERKRVTKWSKCATCERLDATYKMEVDHINPVVPIAIPFESMNIDDVIDRIWCQEHLLQVLCETCHDTKTKEENAERRRFKKERVKNEKS